MRKTSFLEISAALFLVILARGSFAQSPDCSPAITGVEPSAGPPEGGTIVTITGRHFQRCPVIIIGELPCPNLSFGGTNAAQVLSCSDTELVAVTPPHQPGVVPINVPFFNDGHGPTLNNGFTYTGVGIPVSTPRLLLALVATLGVLGFLRVR